MKWTTLAGVGAVASSLIWFAGPLAADSAKEDLRKALKDVEPTGTWIYDDVNAGLAAAREAGKPLLVVFR